MLPAVLGGNDAASIQQDHLCTAGDDWPGDHARHLALGGPRWQLLNCADWSKRQTGSAAKHWPVG